MGYICGSCDFFDAEAARGATCPSCGGGMRDPCPTAIATLERPEEGDWKDPYVFGYEEVEAPWSFRYAQIGIGISTYSFVWCWGRRIVTLLLSPSLSDMPKHKAQLVLSVVILIINCVAALAGGAAAGFWVRNWIPQGLGVAFGAIALPLIVTLIFPPPSWAGFCLTLAVTSVLAVVGAFLGHWLVKPTRIVHS